MIRLGITGGIGSGKSYVSRLLERQFGIPVYDCDREAKRLTASSPEIRQALCRLVGPEVYDREGNLEKPVLARYLFASAEHTGQIDDIIHPVVRKDWRQWCERRDKNIVALESAILYESGFDSEVDEVLLVDAPEALRLQRATERDGATPEQIRARMAQQDISQARKQARFVIQNDGRPLTEELTQIIKELC